MELVRKLEVFRPAVVALVGVTLARIVLPGSEEVGFEELRRFAQPPTL